MISSVMAKKGNSKVQANAKSRVLRKATQNPFERKVQTPKFEILGRKLKGTEQKKGQVRARAIETVSCLKDFFHETKLTIRERKL